MKCLKLVNKDKFIKELNNLKELNQLDKIFNNTNISKSQISKWLKGKAFPSSKTLNDIYINCKDLDYKSMGLKVEDNLDNKYVQFQNSLNYLMKENKITEKELAIEIKTSKSTISSWCNGKSYPSEENIEKLAYVFNTDKQIITGELSAIHYRANNILREEIPEHKLLCDNEIITKKDLGEKYYDFVDFLLNSDFLPIIKDEIDKSINYYIKYEDYCFFEDNIANNYIEDKKDVKELDNKNSSNRKNYNHNITYNDFAHLKIDKCLNNIFDDYVRTHLKNNENLTDNDINNPGNIVFRYRDSKQNKNSLPKKK